MTPVLRMRDFCVPSAVCIFAQKASPIRCMHTRSQSHIPMLVGRRHHKLGIAPCVWDMCAMHSRSQSLHGLIENVHIRILQRSCKRMYSLVETLSLNSTDLIQYANANVT